jgi:hypothetical protein
MNVELDLTTTKKKEFLLSILSFEQIYDIQKDMKIQKYKKKEKKFVSNWMKKRQIKKNVAVGLFATKNVETIILQI